MIDTNSCAFSLASDIHVQKSFFFFFHVELKFLSFMKTFFKK